MSTLTPNYSFILPAVNSPTDQDIWGNELNNNFSNLDTLLAAFLPSGLGPLPYGGLEANTPTGWLLCYGQAVSRSTYNKLFTALTITTTAGTTSGSATITVASTASIGAGMVISGSGIPSGTTVLSVGSGTLVLSANATATATGVSVLLTPYGNGDGSTTFNIPDMRGRSPFGKDDMGGTAAARITGATVTLTSSTTAASVTVTVSSIAGLTVGMSVFGAGIVAGTVISALATGTVTLSIAATATASVSLVYVSGSGMSGVTLGASGGDQKQQSHTHATTVTDPGHVHPFLLNQATPGGGFPAQNASAIVPVSNNTLSALTGVTVANSATGDGFSQNMPPAIIFNWIIKT